MAKRDGRPSWFKLFLNLKPLIDAVPDDIAGKALKAALEYFDTSECMELDPLSFAVFSSMKPYIDESFAAFERSAASGKAGAEKRWGNKGMDSPPIGPLSYPIGVDTEADADAEADAQEEGEAEANNAFVHSVTSEGNFSDFNIRDEAKRRYIGGELGKGVVLLSQEQMDDLLDKLSVEEFDHYVSVVADCELKGQRFRKKTHYQAILDMAMEDRKRG